MGQHSRAGNAGVFVVSVTLMAAKPLLLHLTRGSGQGGEARAPRLQPSHFQLMAESLKIVASVLALVGRRALGLPTPVWRGWAHTIPFVVPAAIYLLQNTLTVPAARMLLPPTFQLLATSKVLFTAVVARVFYGRSLAAGQWLALLALTAGVALGQLPDDRAGAASGGSGHDDGGQARVDAAAPLAGILLMLFNCTLSSLGGVSSERLLKGPRSAELSIFATQLHMAAHTVLLNSAAIAAMSALPGGVLGAYPAPSLGALPAAALSLGREEWAALVNEALNGILISLLMRRIDAIAKNYAFSTSVFVTAGFSAAILGYRDRKSVV